MTAELAKSGSGDSSSAVEPSLDALVALSRGFGSDTSLAIAGGGNTSVKVDDRLFVKASGMALSDVTRAGFVELDRGMLRDLVDKDLGTDRKEREAAFKEALLMARCHPERSQRPSVESVLHHLVPGRFVAHLHATLVNQFTCCRSGRDLVVRHLGAQVSWIELVDPGFALAKAVEEALRLFSSAHNRRPRALLLQNHGLVVSGTSPEEVSRHLAWLLRELQDLYDAAKGPAAGHIDESYSLSTAAVAGGAPVARHWAGEVRSALAGWVSAGTASAAAVAFDDSSPVAALVSGQPGRDLALGGPVTPDQIVYCQSFPLWLSSAPDDTLTALLARLASGFEEYKAQYQVAPKVVLVEGLGLFALGRTPRDAETARLVYADAAKIMQGAARLGGVQFLDEDFRAFIEQWEVESYRRQLST